MDKARFWSYIDVLGGEISGESAVAFQRALSELDEAGARDFVATFEEVIRAVDLAALAGLPVRDASDLPDGEPLPLQGTPLEFFAGALVAAGERTYRAALAEPSSVLSRTWRTEDAPLLLEAVDAVCVLRTGDSWDEGADYSVLLNPADDDSHEYWFFPGGARDKRHKVPRSYDHAHDMLWRSIEGSAQWRKWWSAAGRKQLRANINFVGDSDVRLRRGRTYLSYSYRADYDRLVGADPVTARDYAIEDLRTALLFVADKARLGPLPPMPEVPAESEPPTVSGSD